MLLARKSPGCARLGAVLLLTVTAAVPARATDDEEHAVARILESVGPSTVRIETAGGAERRGDVLSADAPCTGLIVDPDGWILSSAFNLSHRPSGIVVTLSDGERHAARIVGRDLSRFVVLLKIEATGLPTTEFAPQNEIIPGQAAFALGKTYDAKTPSVAAGIVSATGRIWGKAIQTDANVSPVNYGGPLVDARGRVIGVLAPLSPQSDAASAGVQWYDSGIGFAVGLESLLQRLPDLKQGDLHPGVAGVRLDSVDLLAEPTVRSVAWRGPAAKAGLQAGDRLLSFGDHQTRWVGEFRHAIGPLYSGDAVTVRYLRDETEYETELTLVDTLPQYRLPSLGLIVEAADDGVQIQRLVSRNAESEESSEIRPEDRIVQIDGVAIEGVDQAFEAIRDWEESETKRLTIVRGEETIETEIGFSPFPETFTEPSDEQPVADAAAEIETHALDSGVEYWAVRSEGDENADALLVLYFRGADGPEPAQVAETWRPVLKSASVTLVGCEPPPRQSEVQAIQSIRQALVKEHGFHPRQVVVHGAGAGCQTATAYVRQNAKEVGGLLLFGAAPAMLEPMQPATAKAIACFVAQDKRDETQRAVDALRQRGYPAYVRAAEGDYFSPADASIVTQWLVRIAAL